MTPMMLLPLVILIPALYFGVTLLSSWYPAYGFLVEPVFWTTTLTYCLTHLISSRVD